MTLPLYLLALLQVMVFFSSCNSVKFHSELLNYIDIPVKAIHGKQKQAKRTTTFFEFCQAGRRGRPDGVEGREWWGGVGWGWGCGGGEGRRTCTVLCGGPGGDGRSAGGLLGR